jgi:hypothetical protein
VLGVNVAFDVGLLVKLTQTVLKSYGLVDSSIADYIKKSEEMVNFMERFRELVNG